MQRSLQTVGRERRPRWVAAASASLPMARYMRDAIGKLRGLRLPLPPDTHRVEVVAVVGWAVPTFTYKDGNKHEPLPRQPENTAYVR